MDPTQILCESYKNKDGSQLFFDLNNPLELIGGKDFFSKRKKLFDHVVGFAKFAEFLIVAEVSIFKRAFRTVLVLNWDCLVPSVQAISGASGIAGWSDIC